MDNVYLIDGTTLDDIARQVQRLRNTDKPMTPAQIKSELASIVFQEKTVAPAAQQQIVAPDDGYTGLSGVTVEAAPLQGKEVTPGAQPQTIVPDSSYYGLSAVNVRAVQLQEKTVMPTAEEQTVKPDNGYYGLSSVTVGAAEISERLPDAEDVSFSAEQIDPDVRYAIGWNWFAGVVERLRVMINSNRDFTPEEIVYWLGRVTVIPQGYASSEFTLDFATGASGILPTVYKGAASSEFTLNFESSAVGVLSEEK